MTVVAPDFPRGAGRFPGQTGNTVVPLTRLQRSVGEARVVFKRTGERTALDQLHQSGCCKLRFPRPEPGANPEAVLINTAGGLTDGDEIITLARWREDTCATLTTQAAERIYKSRGQPAHINNTLIVERGATAFWLPQETILFERGSFLRRLDASLDRGATLLACESLVFGRTAMGEHVENANILDTWRIRIDGKLIFADGLRLNGNVGEILDKPALGIGSRAVTSVLFVREDIGELLQPVRDALSGFDSISGCSVMGPVMVVRMLATDGNILRRDMTHLLRHLLTLTANKNDGTTAALPRVWSC